MQEKEPILKVEDLHFTYNGEKTALNGVDLNIYEGREDCGAWLERSRKVYILFEY